MADDMGLSDLGCYGGEIATPNLDRLAHNGLCFTRLYNNNVCTVTRADLQTGTFHTVAFRKKAINSRSATLAENLHAAGYSTRIYGKWELYQIDEDREELKNLAAKYSDKVEALAAEWADWRTRTRAMK